MPTILVVDDAAVDRRIVVGILREHDVEIAEASNGREALEYCKKSLPDLLLTDLQMPEVGGLELTSQVSLQYPDLPVVLMTAHGSEEIAAEALACGATSYVPKAQLGRLLASTVRPILVQKETQSDYLRLMECSTRNALDFEMGGDLSLVMPLVDLVQKITDGMGVCKHLSRIRFGIAVEHALKNAILHGIYEIKEIPHQNPSDEEIAAFVKRRSTQAPYRNRKVYVDVKVTDNEAFVKVRDDGNGFDTAIVPEPRSAKAMEPNAGRGLVLMQTFVDQLTFNEAGNEVALLKKRDETSS